MKLKNVISYLVITCRVISALIFCTIQSEDRSLHNAIMSSVTGVSSDDLGMSYEQHEHSDDKEDFLSHFASSMRLHTDVVGEDVSGLATLEHIPSETEAQTATQELLDESDEILQEKAHSVSDVIMQQPSVLVHDNNDIYFSFEDTDLSNIVSYMEQIHSIKFIYDSMISGIKDAKDFSGYKINFRTNHPLSKGESWNLFLTFLHMAGFDVVPLSQKGFYKIVSFSKVSGEILPTYIGVDYDALPDNDMMIRYVYFVKNLDPAKLQNILLKMQAGSAKLDVFNELKALIFMDRASNIRSLMQIASELDNDVLPESLSVIKLQRANVADVISLYKSLKSGAQPSSSAPKGWTPGRKDFSAEYFPQDVTMFQDIRTNSLILMGTANSIKKIEDFVSTYIDAPVDIDAPPVFVYQLEYTNAADIVTVLQGVTSYGSSTPAGQYGGVRDGMKFFSPMKIVAETHSNSVIINSTKEDFETLSKLIKELDTPQRQIGLEVLIVQVSDSEAKALGSQLSGPKGPDAPVAANISAQTFAQNITAQTSGILGAGSGYVNNSSTSNPLTGVATAPVVTPLTDSSGTTTGYSLKSSLAALLGSAYNGVVNEAGAVLVTFGQPIWALFKVLQSMVSVHLVANPFVVVSNNTQAQVNIGEQRRIISAQVVSAYGTTTNGLTNMQSSLGFTIVPQINKNNIVNLQITVTNNQFTVAGSASSALQDQKQIVTTASVANGEVLVLGGLMQEVYASTSRGVPFLEHIPIVGWLFKSKVTSVTKQHFLVFISPREIETPDRKKNGVDSYTLYKMQEAQKHLDIMEELDSFAAKRDPLQRAFFGDGTPRVLQELTGQSSSLQSRRNERFERKRKLHNKPFQNARKNKRKTTEAYTKQDMPFDVDVTSYESAKPTQNVLTRGVHYV